MNKEIKRIIIILTVLCMTFISLIVYISYFQIFKASAIKNNSYNKRLWINEQTILRGSILDRNGNVLAYSEKEGDSYKRNYNYGSLYSHIVGYSYREYGKSGLELYYNNSLLNISDSTPINEIKNIVIPNTTGNNLVLTIDHNIQSRARSLIDGKKGSIVVMNPTTGEIYAMVSYPDFNISNLNENWKEISEDMESPLINRAIQGLYAPGSVFKVITAMAALENSSYETQYNCIGSEKIEGYVFKDYEGKAHGPIDLKGALVKSCNTYFINKSLEIGKDTIGKISERFFFNSRIPFDLPVKSSQFPYKEMTTDVEVAAASIGQGKVLVTPLNMALIASGIANEGEVVKPILVKEIVTKDGKVLKQSDIEILSQGINPLGANTIKDMMVEVVKSGTGVNAKIKNVTVAGKTGTAENSSGKNHAWFIGFAPADNPKVAVSIVLEEDGSTGGKAAAPLARDIMLYTIENIKD
ncbi:MAG: penicillin-binding transpeptidase domain-containing protein [Tissierellaceae bacterium]|nr:penicillin-binding transpeptidase domain-containing protein [Tissierellaceae bacterium]